VRVLLVKLSSLGDLIHCLPALTDAKRARPEIRFEWVVEEAFTEIPPLHPTVETVIPAALRRWRGRWRPAWAAGAPQAFVRALRERRYDLILDAQGLIKSAVVARLARGPVAGFDARSAREPLAALGYGRRYRVPRAAHAVTRLRHLFAAALGYPLPEDPPDFGLPPLGRPVAADRPYLIFVHATTWSSKAWPARRWAELTRLATEAGYAVRLPWYAPGERLEAERIVAQAGGGELLPRLGLRELAAELGSAAGTVAVDTGLAHLAAALGTPGVSLYGASDPRLTGAVGREQIRLATDLPCVPCGRRRCTHPEASPGHPPCLDRLPAERVWTALRERLRPL